MLGFLLVIGSSFLGEISDTIGKRQMQRQAVSKYTVGFLTIIFGILFYVFTAWSRGVFYFSLASLPTFIPRVILELTLGYITMTALGKADRSTFGFVRVLTIPLLLITDLIMGYQITAYQIIGMAIIGGIVAFVSLSGKFNRRGLPLLITGAIIAVITISLYKYNISHFNSVEAEQIIISLFLLVFFFFMAMKESGENPFSFLSKPVFLFQAIINGISAIGSFAYLFLPPSVAITILRSSAVLFSTLSGDLYFKEKKPLLKLLVALGIIGGLLFLI